ncbi:MAG: hypothetical protein ABIF89_02190 [bacterium]
MVIGHKKQQDFLEKSFQAKTSSHAYLLEGQSKLGKKTVAIEMAKRILQEDISRRSHPDYVFIEAETKEIKIDQIREFIWRFSLTTSGNNPKIAIIDNAHRMNQEAQNCFLKTLEEPRGNAIIFLISAFPQMLLPTILSRCEAVKFHLVANEEIKSYLADQKISAEEREEISKVAMGRPGVAVDFISDAAKLKQRKKIVTDFLKMAEAPLTTRFKYMNNLLLEEKGITETLNVWVWYLRRVLIDKLSGVNSVRAVGLATKSPLQLGKIIKKIEETRFLISFSNANPKLALEAMAIGF